MKKSATATDLPTKAEELKESLTEVFGNIQIVNAVSDEFGFMTEVMSEKAYEACAAKFSQICHMIRVEA